MRALADGGYGPAPRWTIKVRRVPKLREAVGMRVVDYVQLLVFVLLVARLLGEIPVGVVTAVVGAPFFLAMLRRVRTGYEL